MENNNGSPSPQKGSNGGQILFLIGLSVILLITCIKFQEEYEQCKYGYTTEVHNNI